jgi:hypothetical protein
LGEVIDGAIIPSHDLVVRLGIVQKNITNLMSNKPRHSREVKTFLILQPVEKIKEKTIVVRSADGLVLGRGKLLKDSLKNLLPRRLV